MFDFKRNSYDSSLNHKQTHTRIHGGKPMNMTCHVYKKKKTNRTKCEGKEKVFQTARIMTRCMSIVEGALDEREVPGLQTQEGKHSMISKGYKSSMILSV